MPFDPRRNRVRGLHLMRCWKRALSIYVVCSLIGNVAMTIYLANGGMATIQKLIHPGL